MWSKKETVYLVDASSYIHRAYHAAGALSNSKGVPTGAVFGFTNMLLKTMHDRTPSRIAVVFDAPGPTVRHKKFPDYKANRPPMPEDLRVQIPLVHRVVDAMNLPKVMLQGFEADDVIAALTSRALEADWNVVIVSGDKDLMQLVGDHVRMWDPQKDIEYDEEEVRKKFGVTPGMLRDLLALMGDSSDNVPGVPGIGPKTAATLIAEFGSLEGVYGALDRIAKKKLKENLENHKDDAFLSRDLVTLIKDAPIPITLERLEPGKPDTSKLRELYSELEFRRLLDSLPPERTLADTAYSTVITREELGAWLTELSRSGAFAVDVETTSEKPMWAELVGVSVCAVPGRAAYIPVGHEAGEQLSKTEVLEALRPLLEDAGIGKIGQNIKYDQIVLKKEGVAINGVTCDTMLASYLLDPSRRGHSLDDLASTHLGHSMIPIKDLIGAGKTQRLFSQVSIKKASEYSCEDADATLRIAKILMPRLEAEGLTELYERVELPLVPVLAEMEMHGVKIDERLLSSLSGYFARLIEGLEEEIFALAGTTFNINSPKQLGEILFVKMGLKTARKTKQGPSTAVEVLEELAVEHELPRKILDYRSIFKLKSTYVDSLPLLVNPATGRIHTSYNQAVAATGRLSSSDPNLQNIPVRTPEGRKIRQAFVPEQGSVFVSADYSQVELRVMAHVSGDQRLKDAFASGEDIHTRTAAGVFGVAPALVTPEMRRKAKAINFGIIYGMGPYKLAGQIGVGMKLARQYLQDYYAAYSGVKRFMDEAPEEAAKAGFVTTILGRKRPLPDLNSPNKIAQQAARRMAVNTIVQGSAADLMKAAMIKVSRAIKERRLPAKMIMQVHDELVLEVEEAAADETAALVKREMEGAYPLDVPLTADTAKGKNWDEAH
jgi:DNA polymerase-1